jgi:lysophospholipase L1-like esterase
VSETPTGCCFTAVAVGDYHSVALRTEGTLVSWGLDDFGQVSGTPTGCCFTAIAAGGKTSMALRSDGTLVSWGLDDNGSVSGTPTASGFTAVATGGSYSVAIRSDGTLAHWGGDPFLQGINTPTGSGFTAVAVGVDHSVAIRSPSKNLLGLGDSVAAGHGLGLSVGFPDNPSAYPMLAASQLGYSGWDYAITGACAASPNKDGGSSLTPVSCTTSVLSDELPAVKVKPDVITLTVGADDIRFGDCFKAVVLKQGDNPCQGAAFANDLTALSKNLGLLFSKLKATYPRVPIFAMLYYNPLPGPPASGADICPLSRVVALYGKNNPQGYVQAVLEGTIGTYDSTAANVQTNLYNTAQNVVTKLNNTIQVAAASAGVNTVPLSFGGHDFCRVSTGGTVSDTWVYGPSIHGAVSGYGFLNETIPFDLDYPAICPAPDAGDSTIYYYSGTGDWHGEAWTYAFTGKVNCLPHPTIDGQRAIADAFEQQIAH